MYLQDWMDWVLRFCKPSGGGVCIRTRFHWTSRGGVCIRISNLNTRPGTSRSIFLFGGRRAADGPPPSKPNLAGLRPAQIPGSGLGTRHDQKC